MRLEWARDNARKGELGLQHGLSGSWAVSHRGTCRIAGPGGLLSHEFAREVEVRILKVKVKVNRHRRDLVDFCAASRSSNPPSGVRAARTAFTALDFSHGGGALRRLAGCRPLTTDGEIHGQRRVAREPESGVSEKNGCITSSPSPLHLAIKLLVMHVGKCGSKSFLPAYLSSLPSSLMRAYTFMFQTPMDIRRLRGVEHQYIRCACRGEPSLPA